MRGQIFEGTINGDSQMVVVVSGDARNRRWPNVVTAPVSQRLGGVFATLPTAIELGDAEPVQGVVLLDLPQVVTSESLAGATNLGKVSQDALREPVGIKPARPDPPGKDPGRELADVV